MARGTRASGFLLVALVLVASWAVAPIAFADEDPASGGEPAGTKKEGFTLESFEKRIREKPHVQTMLLLGRFGPPVIGILLLVLWTLKREKRKLGMLPEPEKVEPTQPFDLLWTGGLLIAGLVVIPLIVFYVMAHDRMLPGVTPKPTTQEGLAMTAAGLIPLACVVILRRARLASPRPPGLGRAVLLGGWTICVASVFVVPSLFVGLLLLEKPKLQQLVVQAVTDPEMRWIIAGYGVLLAPFVEEVAFRGMLYPVLRNLFGGGRRGVWIAAILVSGLFAAIHENLLAALPLFCLAMVLTFVFEKTNSLAACIVAHALNNAFTTVPILFL